MQVHNISNLSKTGPWKAKSIHTFSVSFAGKFSKVISVPMGFLLDDILIHLWRDIQTRAQSNPSQNRLKK